jgi:acetyl-CoA carboxylase biotin carboxyl carrier protein
MNDQEGATQPAREERPQSQQSQQSPRPQPEQQQRPGGAPRNERERGGRRRGGGGSGGHQQQNQPRRSETHLPMEELRDLFALFTEHGLTEFEIEREGIRVHLGRNLTPQIVTAQPQAVAAPVLHATPQEQQSTSAATTTAPAEAAQPTQAAPAEEENLHVIISPIVGTFYRSPSPNTEPFIRLGSHVDPDSVVCIIEAMKLMNEIQAETSGEIAKIYVENGQPVEYGQPLFGVKK